MPNMFSGWLGGGGGVNQPPPPPPDGSGMGEDKKSLENSRMAAYQFDSSALERAAKSARELEKHRDSKEILAMQLSREETTRKEAELKIKEYEAQMEMMKAEQIRIREEEQRETVKVQAELNKQHAKYEDALARQRFDDQTAKQNASHAENLRKQEESLARQEQMRLQTMKEEAALRHEYDMKRVKAEVLGKGQVERENHDLIIEKQKLDAQENRETRLKEIASYGSLAGEGLKYGLANPGKVATTVGLVAGSFFVAKSGIGITARFIESRIGKPALIRESSRLTFGETLRHPIQSWKRKNAKASDIMSSIVVNPKLEARLRDVAIATRHTKRNGGLFRNVLFYGPPGTGKTLFAQSLAKASGMDYAIMTGGDVAPLGKEGVSAIHKVFDWARTSPKGVVLFVDEADAFLRKRSREHLSEDVRATLNAFLHHTGSHSNKFMLVLASNQPEQFDWAINDRLDELIRFPIPTLSERERLVRMYFEKFILIPSQSSVAPGIWGFVQRYLPSLMKSKKSRLQISPDLDYNEICREVAQASEGFSGRQIAKLAIAWQANTFASEDGIVTRKIMMDALKASQEAYEHKKLWADYVVGQDTDAFFLKDGDEMTDEERKTIKPSLENIRVGGKSKMIEVEAKEKPETK